MSRRFSRGFTLIELLVVIAIIGILASVVLVSLQSARKKGNDTRVIAGVQQIRVAIESSFSNNTFMELTGVNRLALPGTGARATLQNDIIAQQKAGGLAGLYGANGSGAYVVGGTLVITKTIDDPAKGYAIYAKLPSNGSASTKAFCMDSTGATNPNSTYPASQAAVNAFTAAQLSSCRP